MIPNPYRFLLVRVFLFRQNLPEQQETPELKGQKPMEEFIHNHINGIVVVLALLVVPFYLQKMQQWHKNSQKRKRERKKRLR